MPVGVSYKVFDTFFDRPEVQAAVARASRKNLSKAGAFVRTRARTLSKKKGKKSASNPDDSSQPGQPPHQHEGGFRKNIFFGYDAPNESVVIGPLAFQANRGEVPERIEFGKKVSGFPEAKLVTRGGRKVWRRTGRKVTATYRARPVMGPALQAEAPNFPELYRDSL